eukprot:SAG31_NODE_1380_length_8582_cov_4.390192_2_plen_180_part_00
MAHERGGFCGEIKTYTLLSVLSASLVALFIGYDIGIMSEAKRLMKKDLDFDVSQMEWVVSAMNIAAGIGMLAGGRLANDCGRRSTVGFGCVCAVAGSIGTSCAESFLSIIAFRLLLGLGIGVATVSANMWMTELSPRKYRGRLGSLFELQVNVGIIVAYTVGWALSDLALSIGACNIVV